MVWFKPFLYLVILVHVGRDFLRFSKELKLNSEAPLKVIGEVFFSISILVASFFLSVI